MREEQLDYQNERVVKTSNVPQPIEEAISLTSCRHYNVSLLEVNRCKVARLNFNLHLLWTQIEEVGLLLLPILNQVSLILYRVHLDLNHLQL